MATALVLLSPGFEEIEAVTIIDLLRRASIKVTVAGLEKEVVTGSHQIGIKPEVYYLDVDPLPFDVLILPGGQPGTNNMKNNTTILEWLRQRNRLHKLLAAICAAPTIFHAAGLTTNVRLTSYPTEAAVFQQSHYSEQRVVVDGNLITSRGVGTAIDFSLYLITRLRDEQTAREIARRILVDWQPISDSDDGWNQSR